MVVPLSCAHDYHSGTTWWLILTSEELVSVTLSEILYKAGDYEDQSMSLGKYNYYRVAQSPHY